MPPSKKPRVWSSEHARINDQMQALLDEDASWDLDKEGALLPFTELVAREMGKKIFRYHEIFGASDYYEDPLFISLKGYIYRRFQNKGTKAGETSVLAHQRAKGNIPPKTPGAIEFDITTHLHDATGPRVSNHNAAKAQAQISSAKISQK